MPLFSGNDLARVLRWGAGYTGGEDPLNLLRDVIDAEEIRLDRWTVVFHPEDKPEDATPKAQPNSTGKKKKIQQQQQQTQQQQQNQQHHHPSVAIVAANPAQGHLLYFLTFLPLELSLLFWGRFATPHLPFAPFLWSLFFSYFMRLFSYLFYFPFAPLLRSTFSL